MSHTGTASKLTDEERNELLSRVSSCQSAYYIDRTPGHRVGSLLSNLQENRDALVEYVEDLLQARSDHSPNATKMVEPSATPTLLEFAEEVRRSGDTRLAGMAIAVINTASAQSIAHATQEAVPAPLPLNVIRFWPDGFSDELERVWRDLVGFIPNYKLYDLQRLLAKWGFTMQVYEGTVPVAAPPLPSVPVINYDALIAAAAVSNKTWTPGKTGCIAFARGAAWFRLQVLADMGLPA